MQYFVVNTLSTCTLSVAYLSFVIFPIFKSFVILFKNNLKTCIVFKARNVNIYYSETSGGFFGVSFFKSCSNTDVFLTWKRKLV